MRSTRKTAGKRPHGRALRALTVTLGLALLAALLLAGTALATAKPGTPTAKAPKGTITSAMPTFTWSKAAGAAKYELRVSQGSTQALKKTDITKLSWKAAKALPTNMPLTWKVRASNAAGAGAWSKSLTFTIAAAGFTIGDAYQGGTIAFVDGSGQHGLIAATADQTPSDSGIIWALPAFQATSVPGGTGIEIGTGSANTDKIIAQNGAGSAYAAGLARAYAGGGYGDWYLPSQDELNQLFLNRIAIGSFAPTDYWSSSEHAANYAFTQYFGDGGYGFWGKYMTAPRVRAVRSF